MVQREKLAQKCLLLFGQIRHLHTALASEHSRTQRNHQKLSKIMPQGVHERGSSTLEKQSGNNSIPPLGRYPALGQQRNPATPQENSVCDCPEVEGYSYFRTGRLSH